MADAYEFETLDEWIEKGSFNATNFKDVKGSDSKISDGTYYNNYRTAVQDAINAGDLDTAEATVKSHGFDWTPPSKEEITEDNGLIPEFVRTERPETPARGDDPEYEGPPYIDWRTEDFTPPGMEFREVPEEERIGNIMAEYYNTKNPLYRQMSEAIVRKFGTRMGTQVQENMILSIGNMVGEMAAADQKVLAANRELYNRGYLQLRTARLNAAAKEATAHVAGNFQLTATKINDLTNQWKAQLAADVQTYGIDVTADVQTYITDVEKVLKGMDILSKIKDNPQAVSFLYNMVFGDTEIDPEDWAKYWDEKYNDIADTGSTETETADTGSSRAQFEASIDTRLGEGNCDSARVLAISIGTKWAKDHYNTNRKGKAKDGGDCPII